MLKTLFSAALVLGASAAAACAGTTVLSVPSSSYPTIASAINAANNDTNLANEYIIAVAPGTYTNDSDSTQINRPMTIEAAVPGSAVILNQTRSLANSKGILLAIASLTVDGLTLQNAAISNSLGGNGAGIRDQDVNPYDTLTVRNSTFINNQMGILTSNNATDYVVLENNLFINNGNPNASYFGHAVYIGPANTLVAIGNEVCGTNIGHDIKSRTAVNIILNNVLYDGAPDPNQPSCATGSASYALDIPNGGQAIVTGNTMIQGAATENSNMFAYGEEGFAYSLNSITFSNNLMRNSGGGGNAIYDSPNAPGPISVQGSNNNFDPSLTQIYPASANQLTGSGSAGGGTGGSLSPDGTISTAPSGAALTTNAGTFSWGGTAPQGQIYILLNGGGSNGWAAKMEVADGGKLYAYNSYLNGWYVWNGAGWSATSAP